MAIAREKFSSQASPEIGKNAGDALKEGRHFQAVLEDAMPATSKAGPRRGSALRSWPTIERP